MQRRLPWFAVGVFLLLLSKFAGAQEYSWTEIVIPGATVSNVFGLNDKGQTAVTLTDGTAGIYGDGIFTPLPPPPQGISGVGARGINNDGVITGPAYTAAGGEQGYILRGSMYTLFARPGWDFTEPRAIANSGLITGGTNTGSTYAGFIYDPDTDTFTDATPPGSNVTIAQGMNTFGRITGNGQDSSLGRYGFVWQQGTITKGKRELQPFLVRLKVGNALVRTNARGINDSGLVVGFTTNPDGITGDGFVGSDARGYRQLVPPGGELPGNYTICEGINNFDQVVCLVGDSAFNPQGAFIGSPPKGESDAH